MGKAGKFWVDPIETEAQAVMIARWTGLAFMVVTGLTSIVAICFVWSAKPTFRSWRIFFPFLIPIYIQYGLYSDHSNSAARVLFMGSILAAGVSILLAFTNGVPAYRGIFGALALVALVALVAAGAAWRAMGATSFLERSRGSV